MVTKTFFRKVALLQQELDIEIKKLLEIEEEKVVIYQRILLQIDLSIRALKKLRKSFSFESIADEVTFFKIYKPYFISQYIFHSKALQLEISKPTGGDKILKKYFQTELKILEEQISEDGHFYDYYRRKATYLDHKYFTTNSNDLKMKMSFHLYDFDEEFTTTNDYKLALIKANELVSNYLVSEIEHLGTGSRTSTDGNTKVSWTSSKVSLIEILYSLHLSQCFNGGNIEFKEVVRETEKNLGIDLGNFYKTIGEIKNKKYNRTKFLQLLTDNLNKAIDFNDI
ncbi:RteC domain-containing protein [Epilithonimonas zeae]|uniref:RteC protein n=1 Tax=Epilithonimonas zeae TaxID=1416779 RepID=A0A1N6GPP6_9FLAO|nr:RteC domain-containing protein [Epilithonimonas zeae]SIO09437.1 RteC protein [Epilithonimonas zeae]